MLMKVYGADDSDVPEQWIAWKESEGEVVELLVRLLSDEKETAIEAKTFGRRRAGDGPDSEAVSRSAREKGAFCLRDVRGFEVELPETTAVRMSQALGETVEAGKPVRLDGKLTPKAKDLLFRLLPDLLGFVILHARKMRDEAAREEARVSGN